MSKNAPQRCRFCRRETKFLCDHAPARSLGHQTNGHCNAALCEVHRYRTPGGLDLCPDHAPGSAGTAAAARAAGTVGGPV